MMEEEGIYLVALFSWAQRSVVMDGVAEAEGGGMEGSRRQTDVKHSRPLSAEASSASTASCASMASMTALTKALRSPDGSACAPFMVAHGGSWHPP